MQSGPKIALPAAPALAPGPADIVQAYAHSGASVAPEADSGWTYQRQVAYDLGESRPCPKAGTPPRDVLKMRRDLLEKFPELDSRREPALTAYFKNMCSVLGLLGYKTSMLERMPEFVEAFVEHVKSEYAQIKKLGIPPSAIAKRAHLWTLPELQDLVTRAPVLFDADKKQRPKSRMIIDLVMRGVHPDIETLHTRHLEVSAESKRIFGAREETAPVAGTAASLVIRKDRESVSQCFEIYVEALREGDLIAKRYKAFEPIIRTMAGFVMAGRYDSMREAARAYRRIYREVSELFAHLPEGDSLVRSTVVLIIKGAYRSAWQARERLQEIHLEMERKIGGDKELARISRSLELLVYSKNYKTVGQALKRYTKALASAEKLFEVGDDGRSLAKTAAYLVVQFRYKSVAAAHREYRRLTKQAVTECGLHEEGEEVLKSIVMSVFKGSQPDITSAREAHSAALTDCEATFEGHSGLARSAAMYILQKRFANGAEALKHFLHCQREAENGLSDNPITAPLVNVFASFLFRESISSIADAKSRYLKVYAECDAIFRNHPDSAIITRTAALLVFRGLYPNAETAHAEYLRQLEAARVEHGHRKDEQGRDVPGVRGMAMKHFERRILSLAA